MKLSAIWRDSRYILEYRIEFTENSLQIIPILINVTVPESRIDSELLNKFVLKLIRIKGHELAVHFPRG